MGHEVRAVYQSVEVPCRYCSGDARMVRFARFAQCVLLEFYAHPSTNIAVCGIGGDADSLRVEVDLGVEAGADSVVFVLQLPLDQIPRWLRDKRSGRVRFVRCSDNWWECREVPSFFSECDVRH